MISQLIAEFRGLELGDKRRERRALGVLTRLVAGPTLSFPRMFPETAELEGFYRFIENPYIERGAILAPHIKATIDRTASLATVLVIHDTSKFVFSGERNGLFTSVKQTNGCFWGHCSLAIDASNGRPLGVLRMFTWVREALTQTGARKAGLSRKQSLEIPTEQVRWWDAIRDISNLCGDNSKKNIHVCDSEGDCYELLSTLSKHEYRFVIRGWQDRNIDDQEYATLMSKCINYSVVTKRVVHLSSRPKARKQTAKRLAARDGREATLGISCGGVVFKRPKHVSNEFPKLLPINVVYVKEINPPLDCDAVEWILLTSEDITTEQDILRVVDIYRKRWMIEEYFKGLKTGCSFEERQLESYVTLQRCLEMLIPLAWLMLDARYTSRQNPDTPAENMIPPQFLLVLREHRRKPLKTANAALWEIAGMGGHIKNNGPPGWLTIWRGLRELAVMVKGYEIAKSTAIARRRCDQS
jgi:transposase-like protein/DDE family transposase